jgi:3-oxoacyl-[acyl-carrier protein] reductase
MMSDLVGKVALVTGASRGIGRAVAVAFARAGMDVAVNFRDREAEAGEVRGEVEAAGRRSLSVKADVARGADVTRLVETVEAKMGPVDILVNNAGVSLSRPFDKLTEEDWDEIMAINLKSVFLVTQAVLPGMRARRWGRIINLSSAAAQTGGVIGPHYAASKAGIHGMTHAYASLLAKEGITANVIAPALIATEMLASLPRAKADLIPVGRFGTAEEVAEVALMLASNGYMTGQTVNVNGGWYMT